MLTRINDDLFLDLSTVTYANFEKRGASLEATLHFADGKTTSIGGTSAEALRDRLSEMKSTSSGPGEATEEYSPSPRMKGWFFRRDASGRPLFLAFVSAKGSSSVRPFDAETGRAFPREYRSGKWQQAFPELLKGAIELTLKVQPNLERDCKQQLPKIVLDQLRKQIA